MSVSTTEPPCNDDAELDGAVAAVAAADPMIDAGVPPRPKLGRCVYGHTPAVEPFDLHLQSEHCICWEPITDRELELIGRAFTGVTAHDRARGGQPTLTEDEELALGLSAQLANVMRRVVGDGPQAAGDWAEIAQRIHDLQARIVMGVAARAGICRRLGG